MTRFKNYASYRSINTILKEVGFVPIKHWNHEVNTERRGFSGFWAYKSTGNILYVTTDMMPASYGNVLLRSAKDAEDFTGGANNYASSVEDFKYRAAEIGKKGF